MKKGMLIGKGVLLYLILTACSTQKSIKTLKLAHGLDVNHSVHKAMVLLSEKLQEKSGGKLRVEIYANSQLGYERECLELLQIGSLDMTKVSAAVMENFAPRTQVFSLPYIFKNRAHHYKVLDSKIGRELLREGEKYWLRGLCFYDAGSRSFYTKNTPINTPEDLRGLKIRVQNSPTAINMVRAFGGSATPISWGELYTALQQGVVDGAENNPPSFYLSRHYEVCKYYSLNEHSFVPDMLMISTHTWKKLLPEERKWLQEAVTESVIYQRKLWQESEKESLEAVQKAGVKILYPPKKSFAQKVQKLYESYTTNRALYQLIRDIQNL
ncbi:MAG: TRAP transporter substrate-binding protein [Microscillaceae bacterium]|nr:TRAP transporter substrate-binding protein [Microscillaceae bacterium]